MNDEDRISQMKGYLDGSGPELQRPDMDDWCQWAVEKIEDMGAEADAEFLRACAVIEGRFDAIKRRMKGTA